MNMLYEICLEGKSSVVFVPTDRSTGAMPSFAGITSLEELIKQRRQAEDDGTDNAGDES